MISGLDLFSGIGGIALALAPWVRPVAYCEVDRYAQAVLVSRMAEGALPLAPIWDDVRSLHRGILAGHTTGQHDDGETIDIITGGFPCQDISVAGNGAGLAGERSGLFFEIARLVGELRPRFIYLENVPAITSRGGREVVGTLTALGYDCRWCVISAAEIGANHKRDRWFLLAHANGKRELQPERLLDVIGGRTRNHGENLAYSEGQGLESCGQSIGSKTEDSQPGIPSEIWSRSHWQLEPDVGRVAHGIPNRVDRIKGLGNAVVPAQARKAFEILLKGNQEVNQ